MISIHSIAKSMAYYILSQAAPTYTLLEEKESERQEIVAYGLEVALGAVVEVLAIAGVATALRMFPEVMAAFITQTLYRFGAGGAHCTAYYRCLISSVGALTLVGFGGLWLEELYPGRGVIVFSILAVMVSFPAVWRWAPADTPANPVYNPRRRYWLRNLAFIFLGCWLILILIAVGRVKDSLLYASVLAVIMQTITITPAGYRWMARLDKGLQRLLPLEGRR